MKFTRRKPLLEHQNKPHTVPCNLCDLIFTNEIVLEDHLNTDHDIKSTSPPPPKKFKVMKDVGKEKEEDKGGKSKGLTKGEKAKKEPSKGKNKMKKSPSPETDTVCEVSIGYKVKRSLDFLNCVLYPTLNVAGLSTELCF